MHVKGNFSGVVSGDLPRVGGGIIEKLHHFLCCFLGDFDCSAEILFSVTSIVGLNAREYKKRILPLSEH